MSDFYLLSFFVSIICLMFFLIKSKFRTKKLILGAITGILVSFVLFGFTISAEGKAEAEQRAKEEQVAKEQAEAEQRAKEEQEAKEQAEAEQRAKEEQEAKEQAEAEQRAKEEQEAKEQAEAEQRAKEEQEAKEQAEAELRAREEQEAAAAQAQAAQQVTQNNEASSGITGYCKDGTVATGDSSARGKANSCYGHGGWVRYL